MKININILVILLLFFEIVYGQDPCGGWYVVPGGTGTGSKTSPASLDYALINATAPNTHIHLAVGEYTLDTALVMRSDIILDGGYDPTTWKKTNSYQTLLHRSQQNVEPNPNRLIAIKCVNISNFVIQDISIKVDTATIPIAGYGTSTYGIYLNNCSDYVISRIKLNIGSATDGEPGANGAAGVNGADGQDGGDGKKNTDGDGDPPPSTANRFGGAGGSSWSASYGNVSKGGDGGDGGRRGKGKEVGVGALIGTETFCPPDVVVPDAEDGQDGNGPVAGMGGLGGNGGMAKDFMVEVGCDFTLSGVGTVVTNWLSDPALGGCSTADDYNGLPGENGQDGADGQDGLDGFPSHNVFFIPGDGQDGQDGEHGGGGGGGGGGGAVRYNPVVKLLGTYVVDNEGDMGGGGGGGGEGGQGGQGGQGGGGGGGVFGIYIWNNGINGQVKDCEFSLGDYGLGAPGGLGGVGGQGGKGGCGGGKYGVNCSQECNNDGAGCAAGCHGGAGGNGGDGGDGGNGGKGGNGADGIRMNIYQNGQPPAISNINLPVEEQIYIVSNQCENSQIFFEVKNPVNNVSYQWFFGGDANPTTATGTKVFTHYASSGVKTITLVANGIPYVFTNILTISNPRAKDTIKLASNTPDSILCSGETATLIASLSQPSNTDSVEWILTGPGVNTSLSGNNTAGNLTFTTPALNQIGTYTIYFRSKTSCCGWSDTTKYYLQVVPTHNPTVGITANPLASCPGNPTTLQALYSQGGNSPTFLWYQNGNLIATTTGQDTLTINSYNNGDVFTVYMVPDYQCNIPDTAKPNQPITLTIYPKPNVSCITPAPVRIGSKVRLSANLSNGTSPYQYQWSISTGQNITNNNFSGNLIEDFTSVGTAGNVYNATLIVTDANGCSDTCSTTITVLPTTVPLFADFSATPVVGCDSVTVTFTLDPNSNANNYEWDFGDGQTGTSLSGQTVTHTYYPSNTYYTVILKAFDAYDTLEVVKPNLVKVYETPTADIYIANGRLCENEPLPFGNNHSGGGSSWQYTWNFSDGNTYTTPAVIRTFPAGNHSVDLTVQNGPCSATDTKNFTISNTPLADFNPSPLNDGCDSLVVELQNLSQENNGGTITSSVWVITNTFTDTLQGNADTTTTIYGPGTYDVYLVVENQFGCRDTAGPKQVVVKTPPVPGFVMTDINDNTNSSMDSLVVEQPDAGITISDLSQNATNITWNISPTTFQGTPPNSVYFAESNITYVIIQEVISAEGCTAYDTGKVFVKEPETLFIPNVFTPNNDGVNDLFEIKAQGLAYKLYIYDRWGNLIYEGNENQFWNGRRFNSGEPVPEGVYMYKIEAAPKIGEEKKIVRSGSVTVIR